MNYIKIRSKLSFQVTVHLKEIAKLEDRLRSRFEWGLIVDITPPDYETRMAILQKKSKKNLEIPAEALNYIANQIQSNIRELEGALTRLLAYSKLQGRPITTELAAEALKDIIQVPKSKKLQFKIFKSRWTLLQRSHRRFQCKNVQNQLLIHVKSRCIYQRELTDFSLPKIGEEFGGRDHTTVIHAHEKIAKDIKADTIFKQEVEDLEKFATNKIKVENCYTTDYEMIKWEIKIVTSYYGIRSIN